MTELRAAVAVTNPTGLHARPAVKLTRLAKSFADVSLLVATAEAGPWFDAKSVVKVMALKAPTGARLFFRASGEHAEPALAALIQLVERDFDDTGAANGDAAG